MRRVAFVLVLAVSGLFVLAAPAFAPCVQVRFDALVRESDVVWWGTVTGTTELTPPFPGSGWALDVRILAVLKGPGSVGQSRAVVLGGCGDISFMTSKEYEQQYVGQTRLFIGGFEGNSDVLVASGVFVKPQNLSQTEQYLRAAKDLGLSVGPPPMGLPPREGIARSGLSAWWALVVALLVLVAVGSFIVPRCRRAHA